MNLKQGKNFSDPLIFPLYKPPGIGSTQFLSKFKRFLPKEAKKPGHFGTLDPFASGVLLVGTSGAMRLMNQMHSFSKTYFAVGKIGVSTPSGDISDGPFELDSSCREILPKVFKDLLHKDIIKTFEGQYMQTPPSFSASKYQGKALYEWAREKKVYIEKPPVERFIHDLEIKENSEIFPKSSVKYWQYFYENFDSLCSDWQNYPEVIFSAQVSGGTYIRKLFEDFSRSLGTTGVLTHLLRSKVGEFSLYCSPHLTFPTHEVDFSQYIGQSVNFNQLATVDSVLSLISTESATIGNLAVFDGRDSFEKLLTYGVCPSQFFNKIPVLQVSSSDAIRFCHGRPLQKSGRGAMRSGSVWVKDEAENLLGLAEVNIDSGEVLAQIIFSGPQKRVIG